MGYKKAQCWKLKRDEKVKSENSKQGGAKDRALMARARDALARPGKKPNPDTALVDSAATRHMLNSRLSYGAMAVRSQTKMGGSSSVMEELEGEAEMNLTSGTEPVKLSMVLYVQSISANLLSVVGLSKEGYTVTFTEVECVVQKRSTVVGCCAQKSEVYEVRISSTNGDVPCAVELWHRRLGYADRNTIRRMSNESVVSGLYLSPNAVSAQCEP